MGDDTIPRSTTWWPQASSPARTPSRSMTPLARGSRPRKTGQPGSTNVPNALAKSMTWAAVRPAPTTPRNPTCEIRSAFCGSTLLLSQQRCDSQLSELHRPVVTLQNDRTWFAFVWIDGHGCKAVDFFSVDYSRAV